MCIESAIEWWLDGADELGKDGGPSDLIERRLVVETVDKVRAKEGAIVGGNVVKRVHKVEPPTPGAGGHCCF